MEMSRNRLFRAENNQQRTLKDLTAVILAGGLGMRLRSVVQDRPKVMANVAGRPFLTYVLDQIVDGGVKRAVICTGFLADSISTVLHDEYRGCQLVYSHEMTPMGTAGALRHALSKLPAFPVLVFNGDSYVNVDLEELVKFHFSRQGNLSLALAKKSSSDAFGLVEVGANGEVRRFSEKESTGKSEWVNAGVYVFEQPVVESIPGFGAISLEREILPKWVGQGLYGFPQKGELFDIGTPSSLDEAQNYFGKFVPQAVTCS